MRLIGYAVQVILGWGVLTFLIYQYVFMQSLLIESVAYLVTIIILGACITFIFSSLEAALLKAGDYEDELLRADAKKIMSDYNDKKIPRDEYLSKKIRIGQMSLLFYKKEKMVAPLVIVSNLMGVLIAAFIPAALHTEGTAEALIIDLSSLKTWIDCIECKICLPGEGAQTLTFFSSALVIIIFGKVIPKRLGSRYSYWFIKKLCPLINIIYMLFGWLGTAILALVEVPALLFGWLKKKL